MNYFIQVLWLLCRPALITICYLVIRAAFKRFEKDIEGQSND
ncbi:MAG: hypothetical protein WCP85_21630 [Mariniphaga sp.]